MWKTTDGGNSWISTTDNIELPFICTLVMDPTNANIIYAGTGESFTIPFQGIRGLGILKTTDGGTTWTRLAATAGPNFYYVNKIAVSPANPQHIYAATSTGVFRSVDAGATWTQVLTAPQPGASSGVPGCQDVVIRADMPTDAVFVSCVAGFSLPGGIWRNTDAGGAGAWTNVVTYPGAIRIGMALAPSSQGTIYAIIAIGGTQSGANYTYLNALGAVMRSTSGRDAGTWQTQTSNTSPTLLNTLLLNYPNFSCGGATADPQKVGQGGYDLDIAVDPTNANTVWVAGIDIFRSNDGGVNWGIAAFYDAFGTGGIHADQHKVVFSPQWNGSTNQTLFVVNDGGIWRSTNANAPVLTGHNALCSNPDQTYAGAAIQWTALNNGYFITQFYHGTVYPGGTYYAGAQDNGTFRGNALQPAPGYTEVGGGDGAVSRFDPLDPSVFYAEQGGLTLGRYTLGGRFVQELLGSVADFSAPYAPYVLDPNETRRLYWGGRFLWRSNDQGNTWASVSPQSPDYISAIDVSPADSQRIVFGNLSGNIYWTSSSFTATAATGWASSKPRAGTVSAVAFHPSDGNLVYAAYSSFAGTATDNHVYKSIDGGRSWVGIDGTGAASIPDVPVSSLLIDPQNPSTIYAGSDLGVFVSTDDGATWSHDSSTFSNTIINALALDRGAGIPYLYAFTFGRGVWRVPLGGALAGSSPTGGVACTYSVSPTSASVDVAGSLNYVTVTTAPGCAWTAQVAQGYVRLMPPASGIGPGRVYYTADPNDYSTPRAAGVFTVQGQAVTLGQQPGADVPQANDSIGTAQRINSVPYHAAKFNTFTSDPGDPVHSCTGSKDFQTTWWSYTAPSNRFVKFTGRSVRADGTLGNGGITLTAYRANSVTTANELGCFTVPRSVITLYYQQTADEGGFLFPVQAGVTYLLEVSATTDNANFTYLTLISSPGASSVSLSPLSATVPVGGKQQFSAQALNLPTPLVRWSISPAVGTIDANGNYKAPLTLNAPASITVMASSLADATVFAKANLTVTTVPVAISAVTSSASFLADAVSPGEMVTLFGNGLGPATLAGAQFNADGTVATTVAQTTITFDNTPAPIIYVSSGFSTVMVPYEVAGKTSTTVVVTYQGQSSAPFTVPVAASAPALYAEPDGKQGAILNFTGSTLVLNTAQNPAPALSTIALYATGEGITSPPSIDGQVNYGPVFPAPVQPVSLTIGGVPAAISFAAAAPYGVAGTMQINATVPSGLSPGAQPVVLKIGENMSSAYVTVWVK